MKKASQLDNLTRGIKGEYGYIQVVDWHVLPWCAWVHEVQDVVHQEAPKEADHPTIGTAQERSKTTTLSSTSSSKKNCTVSRPSA
jgi:hypothetical protein